MKTLLKMAALVVTIAVLLAGASAPGVAAEKGYKVIVHPSNSTASLTRDQVGRYFLKKATTWPGGKTVAPVDQRKDSAVRESFSRDAMGKSVLEVASYWQQQIFSGRAVPPPEKSSDADVVTFVAANEGAIGYVSEGADVGKAKVIGLVD